QRLSVVRGFTRYLQVHDPRTEVPSTDLLPARFRRRVPHLYSDAEIRALMGAARTFSSPLRAATYETLIGLLAVTGLRIGEAVGLDRDDVDTGGALLVVRHGKNDRSRQLPLHPTTAHALGAYAQRRRELCPHPSTPSFL